MGAEMSRQRFWSRSLAMWDTGLLGLSAAYLLALWIIPNTLSHQIWATGLGAFLLVAYATLGRPGALAGVAWRIDLYLALMVAVTAASISLSDSGYILLFVAFSHTWYLSRSRWQGLAWSTAVAVSVVVLSAMLRTGAWEDAGVGMLASLGFSVGLGLWITQVVERGEERATLLDELREAQQDLAASERAAGVLAERERIAQEIHDTLAQGFTSVVMLAQTAQGALDQSRLDQVAARLEQIEAVARENLDEARSLVAASGPAALQDRSLDEALRRLAAGLTDRTGVATRLDLDTGTGLDAEQAVVMLRTAQEALTNVARHAQATSVRIRLTHTPDAVTLDVIDDGCGLPGDLVDGYGLTGMRERASAAGGTLTLSPVDPSGTQVRLSLPRPPEETR
jgi:signal transduction histidine kinase